MLKQEIIDKVTKKSISLDKYGLNDLAWNKENAINLLHEIINDEVGILGGDVYKLRMQNLELLSDNWSCEPRETESENEFYIRSKSESIKYIEAYPVDLTEEIVFSIIFTEKI